MVIHTSFTRREVLSANQLYDIWFRRIRKLLPAERITRTRNLTWLIVGLYLSQSIHLSSMARRLPFPVRSRSTVRRLVRFLKSKAFRPREWYRPVAEGLLARTAAQGAVRLIVDSTKVGTRHQLLMVALAYRKRALPIAWTWIRGARGHSSAIKQQALLNYVHDLVPDGATVELVGDCEFGAVSTLQQLDRWGWGYALRQKGSTLVCISKQALVWRPFDSLMPHKNEPFFYANVILTKKHLYHTPLVAYWERGESDPWLLATNMPASRAALRAYRRRMWLDEFFGDSKGHGVDPKKTRLHHFQRLSRLMMAVASLYV